MIGAAITTERPMFRAGRSCFSGKDRNVFEAGQSAEREFTGDVDVVFREGWKLNRKGMIFSARCRERERRAARGSTRQT